MAQIPGYQTQLTTAESAPYVDLSGDAVPVQWRLYERHTNSLTVTVRDIVDDARSAHWSFAQAVLADGAAVRFINRRQRALLLMFREELKGLVTVTVRTNSVMPTPGYRVGTTPRGTPYLLDTAGDGYAVYLTDTDEVPYIDTAGVPIASDPVAHGWPLPVEVVSLMAAKAQWTDGRTTPIAVVTENERSVQRPGTQLMAFATGSRIAPAAPFGAPGLQSWQSMQAMELSYIPVARVTALCCMVTFPTILSDALIADLVELFANQSRACEPVTRAKFSADARLAEATLKRGSADILGEVPTRYVTFKG
jgi:hypothetical protein